MNLPDILQVQIANFHPDFRFNGSAVSQVLSKQTSGGFFCRLTDLQFAAVILFLTVRMLRIAQILWAALHALRFICFERRTRFLWLQKAQIHPWASIACTIEESWRFSKDSSEGCILNVFNLEISPWARWTRSNLHRCVYLTIARNT